MLLDRRALRIALFALLGLAQSSYAHHSSAPHFDSSRPISIEGVVTAFRFVNPHAWVYLEVTNADGIVENWNCELGAASTYRRQGWDVAVFEIGAGIKIEGIAARRDDLGCSFEMGTLSDGTTIARNGEITRGEQVLTEVVASESNTEIDLSVMEGNWITTSRVRGGGGGRRNGSALEIYADLLTDAGKVAVAAYDQRFDDPALQCSPSSIIRGYSEPNGASDFTQSQSQIVIRHEFMDTVRTIDLTTHEHSANTVLSMTGHSVGWFEGGTLVIETVGFEAGVLLPHPGLLHSEEMRIVERMTLAEGGNVLLRDYEVTDSKFFTGAFTGSNSWTRSDISVNAYNCVELGGVSNIRQN